MSEPRYILLQPPNPDLDEPLVTQGLGEEQLPLAGAFGEDPWKLATTYWQPDAWDRVAVVIAWDGQVQSSSLDRLMREHRGHAWPGPTPSVEVLLASGVLEEFAQALDAKLFLSDDQVQWAERTAEPTEPTTEPTEPTEPTYSVAWDRHFSLRAGGTGKRVWFLRRTDTQEAVAELTLVTPTEARWRELATGRSSARSGRHTGLISGLCAAMACEHAIGRPRVRRPTKMRLSLSGLLTQVNRLMDDLEPGTVVDEYFLEQHNIGSLVFGIEEIGRHLAILALQPERHAEFFDLYVDLPRTRRKPDGSLL